MALKLNRNWIILIVAVTVGGGAALVAHRYLRSQMEEIERGKQQDVVKLVVAKNNLAPGDKLTAENVAVREVPKEWAHANAIRPEQFARVEGKTVRQPSERGQAILWAQLEGDRAPSFSAKLAAGRRAVTVPVDEISSLSGMLEPGDLIDLVVSVRKGEKNITFALLQGVRVLATGARASIETNEKDGVRRSFTTVTLDTAPDDARRIIAAREVGRVTALLRAPGDTAAVSSDRSDALALLGLGAGASVAGVSSVPVIYGGGPIKEVSRLNLRDERSAATLDADKAGKAGDEGAKPALPFGYR